MAYTKRQYQEITDAQFAQHEEEQLQNYLSELDSEQQYHKYNIWSETVKQQEDIVTEILDQAEEGSELESFCTLKEIKKLIDKAIAQVEPSAMDKCELHAPNNKTFINAGFEIQKRQGGKIIDFTNVPEVHEKEIELKKLKDSLKHALTGIEQGTTMMCGDKIVLSDGELVSMPQFKYKKDAIIVKKL
tara:strand:+ start:2468 stop:3031 length:564 start_codon:yes stop_codon:yes gene_type:complete